MKLNCEKTIKKGENTIVKGMNEIKSANDFADMMLEINGIKQNSDVTRLIVYLIFKKLVSYFIVALIIAAIGLIFFKEKILWLMNF